MKDRKELLAYCGLYCGDCAGFSGEIAEAATVLKNKLAKYKFEITARAYFPNQIKEYNQFNDNLQFITTLKCEKICREKNDNETECKIRKCCIEKGFFACYECSIYKECEILKTQEDPHGDSSIQNLQGIKKMGIDAWVKKGKRYWFGSEVDD